VVRNIKNLDELIESARGIVMSPKRLRAQRRAFVHCSTTDANHNVTREIIARANPDFERIFGSND
jgi:hypothetical protein